MKKTNCLRLGVLLFSSIALLASCGAKDNSKKYTVTFYDGETVLKEEKVKENEKVCKYFDIPIQHISNNVLKRFC